MNSKLPIFFAGLIYLLPIIGFSQERSKILIIDSLSKAPIPFVNVQFVDTNDGTYTNSLGLFDMPSVQKIQLSCVGYYSNSISLTSTTDTILLKPKVYTLPEIIISPLKKEQKSMMGFFNQKSEASIAQMPGEEIAVYIPNTQKRNILIRQLVLSIDKRKIALQNTNINFVSVFKINIYEATTSQKIGKLLNQKDLIYTSKILKKKTILDISELYLIIPEGGIFIGIEWVGILNSNSNEFNTKTKSSIEPFISATFKVPNSIVYEKNNWSNYTWKIVNSENWISKNSKKENGYTPCISIISY